ncbi:MAG: hypothetical protein J5I90_06505 [Caldilineales bacterium]|nr:hypothetical protein [Caldilineales bacterium]
MKKTVGGLLTSPTKADQVVAQLHAAGIPSNDTRIIVDLHGLGHCLDDHESGGRAKTLLIAMVIGAIFFGVAGVMAGMGNVELGLSGVPQAIFFVVLFVIIGALSGLFLGVWFIRPNCACDPKLYEDGLHQGGAVVIVRAIGGKAHEALNILNQNGAISARVCEITGGH